MHGTFIPDRIYSSNIEPMNSVQLRLCHHSMRLLWPNVMAMHRALLEHVMNDYEQDHFHRYCCQLHLTNRMHHSAYKLIQIDLFDVLAYLVFFLLAIFSLQLTLQEVHEQQKKVRTEDR